MKTRVYHYVRIQWLTFTHNAIKQELVYLCRPYASVPKQNSTSAHSLQGYNDLGLNQQPAELFLNGLLRKWAYGGRVQGVAFSHLDFGNIFELSLNVGTCLSF